MDVGSLPVRFLLVDDDAFFLQALGPHVAPLAGAEAVETAATPAEALAKLDAAPPGRLVVVSDFNLKADRTGVELLAEVARRRPDALRVLMSGYAADQLGLDGGHEALHGFIEKPLRLADMLPALRALAQRHFGVAPSTRPGGPERS